VDEELAGKVRRVAEELAESFPSRLDFSEASLAFVEELLDEASEYVDTSSEDLLSGMAEQFGCYILEVGRRTHGGRYQWYGQRNAPVLVVGEPEFRVAVLTWDKVRGRLSGDKADNIPFFYDGFADRVRTATPGTDALYV
jgi:hypothetical protein